MTSEETATPAHCAGLLASLGVVGLDRVEPIILGALVSGDPLLLIGTHGTGKSYLLERIATALDLRWRHYNASLLNFDDLVGYPLPNANGGLDYVQTPSSVWGAEAVFIDEISRCRPDIQNKLFPIIHERRVQGLLLETLRYRWSAMNPPGDDDDEGPSYIGSEPLDLALADRFAFIVDMPGWEALTLAERESLVLNSGSGVAAEAKARLTSIVAEGRLLVAEVLAERAGHLATYIRIVIDLLAVAGITLTGRRAALLLRNVTAVHAARLALDPAAVLGDSAFLALSHSLPQPASGVKVDGPKVLACHREAWRLAGAPADDPLRQILSESDPVRRALRASRMEMISAPDFSSIVADTLASLRPAGRHAFAAALFERGAAGKLVAAVAEQCAVLYAALCTPQPVKLQLTPGSTRHKVWKEIESTIAMRSGLNPDTALLSNLLASLFNAQLVDTIPALDDAVTSWESTWLKVRSFA